jgi:hypothetical protein
MVVKQYLFQHVTHSLSLYYIMQNITGAGILVVEFYKNTNCYVLFRSPHSKEYNDPGGLIDPGETPQESACRECREETANLLKFNVSGLCRWTSQK